ncbi:hypothetical protein Tco_0980983, partial [Tanacetum coccineum]
GKEEIEVEMVYGSGGEGGGDEMKVVVVRSGV